MSVLPASVRVAAWASAALADRLPMEQVATRALPDLDHVEGLTPVLRAWADMGERAVLVALPRPGDLSRMPRAGAALVAAAVEAEEAVYVPGVGGAAVPRIEPYGPPQDQGWQGVWTTYDADPVPVHRVQAVDLSDVEVRLRLELAELSAELAAVPGGPLGAGLLEELARDRLDQRWGLPSDLPRRAQRVIELAGSALALADVGRDSRLQAVDSSSTVQREQIMARLADHAAAALADATNVAALHLAGWR